MLEMREMPVTSNEAVQLMQELSDTLEKITGSNGRNSFQEKAMENPRSAFVIAYLNGKAAGCGAIQEVTEDIAEVKRVYAKESGIGVGKAVITTLEEKARELGYHTLILETRKVNENAVRFYLHNGYEACENYGKYIGREEAVCFKKVLID